MTSLADAVLPLIRTRTDLHRWSAANRHGRDMHAGVDILEAAVPTGDPADVFRVAERALDSALKVITRADDSSGIIGDACRRLIALHPIVAAKARAPYEKVVDWMMRFQFDGTVDVFHLDPVDYAPVLGEAGMRAYRLRLQEYAASLGPRPSEDDFWSGPHAGDWFTIFHNERRLAVYDRDVAAIIRTHARDLRVAAWLDEAASALAEIGEADLAIDWARRAAEFDRGHQAQNAAQHWRALIADHRPGDVSEAARWVFDRWPTSSTASDLRDAVGDDWPAMRDDVLATLSSRPDHAVGFALRTLEDPALAWRLAHELGLESDHAWGELAAAYAKVDPLAVLPVHSRLVESALVEANAQNYKAAAARLATMRGLAAGTAEAAGVDDFIAELRLRHVRRPRLQQEFDRAQLP